MGHRVVPFKKGPDYIDAAWLTSAAGASCRNLDLFLMSPPAIAASFADAARGADLAVIEGNRGLFDGMDAQGTCSTAELAKLLRSPVLLIVDCTKSTRTIAALVLGCMQLDPEVAIGGVILNRTAGPRHESLVREAIEGACRIPVMGAIPRDSRPCLPERHLGLVPPQEHTERSRAIERIVELVERHVDREAILDLAGRAPPLHVPAPHAPVATTESSEVVRIGVFKDEAFQFYYPENLEALTRAGGRLLEISPLRDAELPDVDALYIGGGFPEMLAAALSENTSFLTSVRRAVEDGLPVYAECGGAVYLGEQLHFDGKRHAMAAALPVSFAFQPRPQGHGYTILETVEENPFFPVGESLRGHEFHYTYMQSSTGSDLTFAFRMHRGHGIDGQRDGLCHRNVLACYTHVHAIGIEHWAPSIVRAAVRFRRRG
jgi:cobyrinic acid a,c-diamide synthase